MRAKKIAKLNQMNRMQMKLREGNRSLKLDRLMKGKQYQFYAKQLN